MLFCAIASFPVDGFLNLNKPFGLTSHDCVAKVRRLLHQKKVGHGGTLDPAATGVLPIALGKATRLLQYLPHTKAYRATVRFGVTTTTDDLEGEVLQEQAASDLTLEAIQELLPQFQGTIAQIPPAFSAIQVQGKRLYERARAGEPVEVPARTVEIFSIAVLDWRPGECPEVDLAIACGSGTYIRAIARDLGKAAGTGATLAALCRTESSGFTLDTSLTLEELESQIQADSFHPLPLDTPLTSLPSVNLSFSDSQKWLKGQRLFLPPTELTLPIGAPLRIYDSSQKLLGIGKHIYARGASLLTPALVLG